MGSLQNNPSTFAAISAVLYLTLSISAACYYAKFRKILKNDPLHSSYYRSNLGKFDEAKMLFFLVLFVSALLDIPIFLGCMIQDGPTDCQWEGPIYEMCWFLHLLAVCGYAYTICIPCILWSDMINSKDGKLFYSSQPYDWTKRFFQITLMIYVFNTLVNIIACIVDNRNSRHNRYVESNFFAALCETIEPVMIVFISLGCLFCSIRLQTYVRRAKLGLLTELKFLFHLNITMSIILISYLCRALFVLRLGYFMPSSYKNTFKCSYFVWLVCTRWLPYIFCSFCLIFTMRHSGDEVAARYSTISSTKNVNSDAESDVDLLASYRIGQISRVDEGLFSTFQLYKSNIDREFSTEKRHGKDNSVDKAIWPNGSFASYAFSDHSSGLSMGSDASSIIDLKAPLIPSSSSKSTIPLPLLS